MSDLHNIQKSLAKQLNAEFEDANSEPGKAFDDQNIVGLAERAQEKEDAKEKVKTSEKKGYQPIGIALVMFVFAAVVIAGETIL
jgi:hypothetical protein